MTTTAIVFYTKSSNTKKQQLLRNLLQQRKKTTRLFQCFTELASQFAHGPGVLTTLINGKE